VTREADRISPLTPTIMACTHEAARHRAGVLAALEDRNARRAPPAIRPEDSAEAAHTPGQAAAGATRTARAADAGDDPATAKPAATDSAAAASVTATAATAATVPAATASVTAATAAASHLHAAPANVFLVEEIKRGETDVGHLLFAENEALIRHGIAGLRDVGRGRRGCGCAADQRNTQSGGTQHADGAGFAFTSLCRSSLDP
jgi:hypothetical protein